MEINPFGAEAKIKIGVANCRRLWRVKREPRKWEGVSDEVQLLADGGACMWTPMCCHLEETSLKEHFVATQEGAEYLLKIRHPNNPFSSDPSEEITYSTEMGKIITDVTEVPRTVFHFVKRTNRTKKTARTSKAELEDAHRQALDIVETVHISSKIRKPNTSATLKEFTLSHLSFLRSQSILSAEESTMYEDAIAILNETKDPDEVNDDAWDNL